MPEQIKFTSDDLKGRVYLSFNGEGKYTKREMVLEIVHKFMSEYPETTLSELKATFKRDFLGRFAQYEFIQEDVETAKKMKRIRRGSLPLFHT